MRHCRRARNIYRRLVGKLGRAILIWVFRKWNGGMDWIDLAKEVVYTRKRSNELLGTIKCGKFLD